MSLLLNYTNEDNIFCEKKVDEVTFLSYSLFENLGMVKHGFSTRIGGVSEGICSTMNLSYSRGDSHAAVTENFKRITKAIGTKPEHLVFTAQTHTTNIRVVTKKDQGKGYISSLDYEDVDGLVTNEQDLCLATFYADCVPLFFVDPVKKAIGLVHSGWRGTVGKIGKKAIEMMKQEYGSEARDIRGAIGPSICQACYEVSEDVIVQFAENFKEEYLPLLYYKKKNGRYQLDLWKANEIILKEAGILPEHLAITNVCTCCNDKVLFSHRASNGKRGNLGAFLELC